VARGAKESVAGVSMKRCGPSNAGVPYTVCLKEAESSRLMRQPGPAIS
jgi:hypothetical protein